MRTLIVGGVGSGKTTLAKYLSEFFDRPYFSRDIAEYWRRWHITMGTWFKDYIFYPLSVNPRMLKFSGWSRKHLGNGFGKRFPVYVSSFIVWFATGIWHGASWNFVIWGLMFAIILVLEKLFLGKLLEKTPTILRRIYTLLIIFISWTVFDATSMSQIGERIGMMFGFANVPLVTEQSIYYLKSYLIVFAIGIIGATPLPSMLVKKLSDKETWHKFVNLAETVVLPVLLIVSTAYLVDGSFNPFLYFRF